MAFKNRGDSRYMTETQTPQPGTDPSSGPQWTSPAQREPGSIRAREGEYAWRGSGPQHAAAQPVTPPSGQAPAWGSASYGAQESAAAPPTTAPGGVWPGATTGAEGTVFMPGTVPPGGPGAPNRWPDPPAPAPRRRAKFGLGVVSAFVIAAAAIGGVAGSYFSGHYGATGAAAVSTITGSNSAKTTTTIGAVAKAALPSVVQVNETTQNVSGTGSGMVISSNGLIVTNNHVIADYVANGGQLTVTTYDGKTYNAKVIGYIAADDVAVIQAQGVSGWTPVTFADSNQVQVGDETIAIGSPDQLQNTVTSGIVSALNRKVSITESTNNGGGFPGFGWQGLGSTTTVTYSAIQTDASINPGNSGGPLLNTSGQVIGMNSAIYSSSSGNNSNAGSVGLGFAIPSNTVTADIKKIEAGGGDSSSTSS
jgi:putative serine protease PepD